MCINYGSSVSTVIFVSFISLYLLQRVIFRFMFPFMVRILERLEIIISIARHFIPTIFFLINTSLVKCVICEYLFSNNKFLHDKADRMYQRICLGWSHQKFFGIFYYLFICKCSIVYCCPHQQLHHEDLQCLTDLLRNTKEAVSQSKPSPKVLFTLTIYQ